MEVLVSARADLNAKGLYGDTPLHLAASYGQTGVAEVLANANADVNAKDHANKTPLDWARKSYYPTGNHLLKRTTLLGCQGHCHGHYNEMPAHPRQRLLEVGCDSTSAMYADNCDCARSNSTLMTSSFSFNTYE